MRTSIPARWLVALSLAACGRFHFADEGSECAVKPVGAACDDGYSCTDGDLCDADGACRGTPNDGNCVGPPWVCLPECFGGPTGCGVPPTDLVVSCGASSGGDATCSVAVAGGVPGQTGCLSCEATVGFVPLVDSDFSDGAGTCSADGWQLVSGSACNDGASGCATGGAIIACCADFTTICDSGFGGSTFLKSVFEENCGGGFKQWRINQAVDATSVTDLRACFDAGETFATINDGVFGLVSDGVSSAQLSCVQGDTDWRAGMMTVCTDLPSWTFGNPNLTLTLAGHNDAANANYPTEVKRMMLDNVLLYGREPACTTQTRAIAFREDFTGCPSTITEGFNGWSVTEGAPLCGTACSGAGAGAIARGSPWTITRRVDTTALSGDVQACLLVGHVNAVDENTRVSMQIDVGDGSGWRTVGRGSIYRAGASQCQQICFNLTTAHPAAAHNPSLGIAVSATSPATTISSLVDDITISGIQSCAGEGFVSVGPLTDAGGGVFEVLVSNDTSQALTAQLTCTWSGGAQRNIASTPVRLE